MYAFTDYSRLTDFSTLSLSINPLGLEVWLVRSRVAEDLNESAIAQQCAIKCINFLVVNALCKPYAQCKLWCAFVAAMLAKVESDWKKVMQQVGHHHGDPKQEQLIRVCYLCYSAFVAALSHQCQ